MSKQALAFIEHWAWWWSANPGLFTDAEADKVRAASAAAWSAGIAWARSTEGKSEG